MEEGGFTLPPINDFHSGRTFQSYFEVNSPQLALQDMMILLIMTLICHEMLLRLSSSDVPTQDSRSCTKIKQSEIFFLFSYKSENNVNLIEIIVECIN